MLKINKKIDNKKLLAILNAQSSIVLTTDGKKATYINDRFLKTFNFKSLKDFRDKYSCICELFINKKAVPHLMSIVDGLTWIEYIKKYENKTHHAYMIDCNGNEKVYEVTISDITIDDTNEYIVIFNDITKLLKANSELEQALLKAANATAKFQLLNSKLNKIVEDKTKELEKQHLQHQKEIKFSVIGQMAAGITHEINTPLTYLKGIMEMSRYDLEDMPDNEFKQRLLDDNEKVMDGIKRMGIIVESMREMSQTSSLATKKDFNIYSTIITILRMLNNRLRQTSKLYINNEPFELEKSDKEKYQFIAPIVKQRLEQVWVIILSNALDELVKIEDFENRRIDINISKVAKRVIVKFQDNAGGISPSIKNDIFEPFVGDKESSGIGIGLNVAKKIIEEHGGNIEATNKNNGACFTVELPMIL